MKKEFNNKWFSIIEVLIAILIFSLWITSVYMLIASSLKANSYNKNQIIAANLAREELELIKNIRDSNYKTYNIWNKKISNWLNSTDYNDASVYFLANHIYTLENNYANLATFPIKIKDITSGFEEWKDKLNSSWMLQYRLCLDSENRYTYDCSSINKKTIFYRFLKISKVKNKNWIINNALELTSKVIWYHWSYHNIELKTILTDWKRL